MKNTFIVYIRDKPFENIKNNLKTIEGRIPKGYFSNIKKGDLIKFYNIKKREGIYKKVKDIINYKDFNEMLSIENINNVLPDISNIDDGVKHYLSLYSNEDINNYGVISIHLKNI